MADPKPIQQKIEIDADTAGADQVERALGSVEQQTKETAQATEKAASTSRSLESELKKLIAAEQAHKQALSQGETATEQDADASRKRRQEIDRVSRALAKLEDDQVAVNRQMRDSVNANREFDDSGKRVERRGETMSGVFGTLNSRFNAATFGLGGMVTGMIGGSGLVSAFQAANEAADEHIERLEKIVELQNQAAKATLDLQAINQVFNQGDEDIVSAFSVAAGRDFTESAGTITQFRSANAALSREEQNILINESLLPLALTTSGDIDSLAKFIGRAAPTTTDPREINNLVLQGIALAGEANPDQFLGAAGELLVSGTASGLDNSETLGLLAFGSTKLETAQVRTQLRNTFKKFSADPNTREGIEALGVSTDGNPLDILRGLAEKEVSTESIIELVGLENSDIVQAITGDIGTVNRFVDETAAAVSGGDIAKSFVQSLVESSPRQARALQISQQEQAINDAQRQDGNAQVFEVAKNAIELELERAVQRGDIPTSAKNKRLESFDSLVGSQNFFRNVRGRIAEGTIDLTPDQEELLDGRSPVTLTKDQLTPGQIAEAAAITIEKSGLLTDLLPGGDVSTSVELSDAVRSAVQQGPEIPDQQPTEPTDNAPELPADLQPAIDGATSGRVFNNWGNIYTGTGDPFVDDLDGRSRV